VEFEIVPVQRRLCRALGLDRSALRHVRPDSAGALRRIGTKSTAVVAPPRDDAGTSVKARKAMAGISNALGGHAFQVQAK
jgi:hypothetical protein